MILQTSSSQLHRVFSLVFGVAFSVVALAVIYGAMKQNTEGRSKAALAQTIVKQWEFNESTTEGWGVLPPNKELLGNGYLSYVQAKPLSTVGFINQNTATVLPKGLKTLTFSLSVGASIHKPQCPLPPSCNNGIVSVVGQDKSKYGCDLYVCRTASADRISQKGADQEKTIEAQSIRSRILCSQDIRACPDGSYVGRSGASCVFETCPVMPVNGKRPVSASSYSGYVYYKLAGKNTYEKPLMFTGTVNGKFTTVTVNFPEIQGVTLEQLKIVFMRGIRTSESVKIDWIRLTSPIVHTPSVTRTGTPRPCVPAPYCAPGSACKILALPEGSVYCPTPTNSQCQYGVKTVSAGLQCGDKFSNTYTQAIVQCQDGYKETINTGKCESRETYDTLAKKICGTRSNCSSSPTPSSCGPVACRIPPAGCKYINPTACSCGTIVCNVTTATPTMTPIPTPIVVSAFKNAAVFDGASTYLKLLQSNTIQPKLGFTLEGWFKPKAIKSGGAFISKMSGNLNSIDIQIMNEIDPEDSSKVRFHYEFGVAGGGSCLRYSVTHDRIVSQNQAFEWQHIAGVIQDNGNLDLFINGQRSTSSSGSIASVCSRDLPIIIGARELSVNNADSFLAGLVDEVRISRVSRYAANFNPSSVPFSSDSNTIALYHLDQFSDELNGLVQDYSGNGFSAAQWGNLSFTSH